MEHMDCHFKKYKNQHTRIEYLNSIQKKYKYRHNKNKIIKVKNSFLRMGKNLQELIKIEEIKVEEELKEFEEMELMFGILKCLYFAIHQAK